MTADGIYAQLRALAPHIAFGARKYKDESFRWDGDGPDPVDQGFDAYDIDVFAKVILNGEMLEEEAHLGGHYLKPEDKIDDVGGYLPQMLQEAAQRLMGNEKLTGHHMYLGELMNVCDFLRKEMRQRWQEQQDKKKTA